MKTIFKAWSKDFNIRSKLCQVVRHKSLCKREWILSALSLTDRMRNFKGRFSESSLLKLHYFRLFSGGSKQGFIFSFANKSRHSSKVNNGDLAKMGLLMFHQADLLRRAHQILIFKEYSPKSHLFKRLVSWRRFCLLTIIFIHVSIKKLEVSVKMVLFFTFNVLKIYFSNLNKLIALQWHRKRLLSTT